MQPDTVFTVAWFDSMARRHTVTAHGLLTAHAICEAFSGRIYDVTYFEGQRLISVTHEGVAEAAARLETQG